MRLRHFFAALCLTVGASAVLAQDLPQDLPRGAGLPLAVQTGVAVAELHSFDENEGTFEATIDLRLRWRDARLARADGNLAAPPLTLRDEAAVQQLAKMWSPNIVLANQVGEVLQNMQGLQIFPDGTVENLRRLRAVFKTGVNFDKFPFDRQKLTFEIVVNDRSVNEVILRTLQADIDFSKVSNSVQLAGWNAGLVDLSSVPLAGWYSSSNARVIASVDVTRQPGLAVASIYIPLIASLLIPLLALWFNRMEEGVFQVETFELVNIIIGGFFAVIALNFTVLSSYPALADGNNSVMKLLALNYCTLAMGLLISIVFGRFNVLSNLFGVMVQEQAYTLLMWALPLGLAATVAAIIGAAYV
jgi:hypothetical protein